MKEMSVVGPYRDERGREMDVVICKADMELSKIDKVMGKMNAIGGEMQVKRVVVDEANG